MRRCTPPPFAPGRDGLVERREHRRPVTRLEQVAPDPLVLNQGTLYVALVRLEQRGWIKGAWARTENNRDAKFYTITRSGTRALSVQTARWRRLAGLMDRLLLDER